MNTKPRKNRLASETSPYLRQHAENPVDWMPWSDEALARAKAEDKPIFLSVGYSSCHWCHVMAHESFESQEVADLLNRDFIPIKVDREEHPDLDALYMTATQLMTERGGWPNSVWLTPDGRPWYAGTYFPRESRPGRIGFISLLQQLSALWRDRRQDVEKQANALTDAIRKQHEHRPAAEGDLAAPARIAATVQQHFADRFDARHGGFGDAPKFPPHSGLLLLLRSRELVPNKQADVMICRTLDAMLKGGIYDQIGGGFHRYSTDDHWLLPHFEKMLYDNALLLKAYALAADAFNQSAYRRVVMETAEWLEREMSHPDGGFFSALDADSEGEEGKFYTWDATDIVTLLGEEEANTFAALYNILPGGNFSDEATGRPSGLNIPHVSSGTEEPSLAAAEAARHTLLRHRLKRHPPGLDSKIISGWNGLMISALAVAGLRLNHPPFIERALKCRMFIATHLWSDNRLHRCWCNQPSPNEGGLDDYAALALADLDLFDATRQPSHLHNALTLTRNILERFYDKATGTLYMTSDEHPVTLLRMKDVFDQGSPSGTGLAVVALLRTAESTSDDTMRDAASAILAANAAVIQRLPSAAATLADAALATGHTVNAGSTSPMLLAYAIPGTQQTAGDGSLGCDFRLDVPSGWSIDPEFSRQQDVPFNLSATRDGKSIDVTAIRKSVDTWTVRVQKSNAGGCEDSPIDITLRYRLCTDSECLPEQETHVIIEVGGRS